MRVMREEAGTYNVLCPLTCRVVQQAFFALFYSSLGGDTKASAATSQNHRTPRGKASSLKS